MSETVVVTGALSNTGQYAARILLDRGYQVRTLTFHPQRRNPFGERVRVLPYNFDQPRELSASLEGATTLINTYWVRFPRGGATFAQAVENSRTLISAARNAGIKRIVHVSIANPSPDSPLGYYKSKAEVEQAIQQSGLSYSILRPTVIFGPEDILINNIAWFVRRFPIFAIPGDGRYSVRPIYVGDMAQLMADSVAAGNNRILDAVGPESYTFEELVRSVAKQLGKGVWVAHVPARLAYVATILTGRIVGDVVLTWEEYLGLMNNLLASDAPSQGKTRLSEWLQQNAEHVGRRYASEVKRHFNRPQAGNGGTS